MIHIAQWLLIRKYAPFIVSSIVCLPYCVYVFKILITTTDYKTIILWTFIGLIMTALNLMLAYKIAMIFDKIPR
ncbi:MAG: hypothetical protein LBT96_03580, partial [Campylobacteraceae bacterium]|nr:hypothetical protein [Campylobacteraceae bacterium]